MTWRTTLWTLLVLLAATAVGSLLFQRQLTGSWLAFGVHPDVLHGLDESLEDQKRLADLDPEHRAEYRRRFERLETLRNRLRILDHSREELMSRYGVLMLVLFGGIVVLAGTVSVVRQRRDEVRLERLRTALAALSTGRTHLDLGERRGDVIGRVAAMVEETSRVMARDRRRLDQLKNLSAWQEAARRHAHEMRTPLTAAHLEVERLRDLAREPRRVLESVADDRGEMDNPLQRAAENLSRELARLADFTRGFADFARLPRPRRQRQDLGELAAGFVHTFSEAWPGVELRIEPPPGEPLRAEPEGAEAVPSRRLQAAVDRDLLIQVLVNLVDNAAQAGASRVSLCPAAADGAEVVLDVRDDGPGVPEALRERLFEPYVSSKKAGQGMGLGLAISKKILLDHGGDLELAATGTDSDRSGTGCTFRLTLPVPAEDRRGHTPLGSHRGREEAEP